MSREAYVPYAPLNVLKPVCPNLWIVDGPDIGFGAYGVSFPFPTRMTVVRLPGGDLWLHSPTEPAPPLVDEVRKLGRPRFLIAPNTLHYWWLPDWAALFPEAEIHAAPGLARKAKRPVRIDHDLGGAGPSSWSGVIDQVLVESSVLTEVDFFHRPSRTLILTDLIENFELPRIRSWFYRALVKLGGAADPDGRAPADLRMSFRGRRQPLKAAVERMIDWDPVRIIMAHGRWYEGHGDTELRRAFRWAL